MHGDQGSTRPKGRAVEAFALSLLVVSILIAVRMLEHAFKRLRGGSDEPDTETEGAIA